MRGRMLWLLVFGLVGCDRGEAGPRAGPIEGWDTLRDSVVASVESVARQQQYDRAFAQPVGGSPIPIRKFVLEVDVFTDFDCSSCDAAEQVIEQALRKSLLRARSVIHLPSETNQWSMKAAQAFDCAYEDGQGSEMYAALRDRRLEFATVSWDSLATSIDVYDREAFRACMAGPPTERIQAGMALAKRLHLRSAPAVVIDGWLVYPLTLDGLTEAIAAARKNRVADAYR